MSSLEVLTCPRDGSSLVLCAVADCSYWWCEGCHGLLLDREQLAQLRRRALDRLPLPPSQQRLPPESIREGTARCACDGITPMSTIRRAGITIDVCYHCRRTWLDGGELDRLLSVATAAATPPAARQASVHSKSSSGLDGDILFEVAGYILEILGSAIVH